MDERCNRWAEDFVADKINRIDHLFSEAMKLDDDRFEELEDIQSIVQQRLKEIRANSSVQRNFR